MVYILTLKYLNYCESLTKSLPHFKFSNLETFDISNLDNLIQQSSYFKTLNARK